MLVKVKAKSGKGKNRIKEHGSIWYVQDIANVSCREGTSYLLESLEFGYWRWVSKHNDPDFQITHLTEKPYWNLPSPRYHEEDITWIPQE